MMERHRRRSQRKNRQIKRTSTCVCYVFLKKRSNEPHFFHFPEAVFAFRCALLGWSVVGLLGQITWDEFEANLLAPEMEESGLQTVTNACTLSLFVCFFVCLLIMFVCLFSFMFLRGLMVSANCQKLHTKLNTHNTCRLNQLLKTNMSIRTPNVAPAKRSALARPT